MKTDTLTPIGATLTTHDRHFGLLRTWRVVAHGFAAGRVCELVVLETTEAIDREEIPRA